jgi:hypothetical protein
MLSGGTVSGATFITTNFQTGFSSHYNIHHVEKQSTKLGLTSVTQIHGKLTQIGQILKQTVQ